jgi:hypothetical protein
VGSFARSSTSATLIEKVDSGVPPLGASALVRQLA